MWQLMLIKIDPVWGGTGAGERMDRCFFPVGVSDRGNGSVSCRYGGDSSGGILRE